MRKPNAAELCVAVGLRELGLYVKTNYRFHKTRKWELDVAEFQLPLDQRRPKIAVEIEGGHFTRGRHVRPIGFQNDCIKYTEAQIAGWIVFRFTTQMALEGTAKDFIRRYLDAHG